MIRWWAICLACLFVLLALGTSNSLAQDKGAGGIAQGVVDAWEKAGAKYGNLEENEYGGLYFGRPGPFKKYDLPAFEWEGTDISALLKLPQPTVSFGLALPKVKDGGLKGISRFKQLHAVTLSNSGLTDRGLKDLLSLKQLKKLTGSNHITDGAGKEIARLKEIEMLDLSWSKVTDKGMNGVATLPRLRSLTLHHTKLSDMGFKHLCRVKGLQELYLGSTDVTLKGTRLNDLSKLRILRFDQERISTAGVKQIASLKQLELLDLRSTAITDADMKAIGQLTGLHQLGLRGTAITDKGLKSIEGLKQLRVLNLSDVKVTDASVKTIAELEHLKDLFISGTKITVAGAKELKEQLPKVLIIR